ncbi:MAG: DNA polymerase III subunit chi [Comamonas sp.]
MTRVDFHLNVGDPGRYASRLLRKASAQGARLLVLLEPAQMDAFDDALWSLGDTEFLPHCRSSDAEEVRRASPITLHAASDAVGLPAVEASVLVNLARDMPAGYERYARVIEILPGEQHDAERVAAGRQRWKHYKQQGCTLTNHVVSDAG